MPELTDERFFQEHADFCSVFSNANRLKLLEVLRTGDAYSVSELEEATGISQSTISQHLKLMRNEAIVTRQKEGVKNFYSLTDDRIVDGMEIIRAVLRDRASR